MDDLIAALTILRKYGNPLHPTWCEHDVLHIVEIDPAKVSAEDIDALERLGFFVHTEDKRTTPHFKSFRFGSA